MYQATQAKLLAEFTVVFHDKRTASRLLFTETLVRLVNRLVVVNCVEDIQGVVEMLHVPHSDKDGVVAVITDLDPKVLWHDATGPLSNNRSRSQYIASG